MALSTSVLQCSHPHRPLPERSNFPNRSSNPLIRDSQPHLLLCPHQRGCSGDEALLCVGTALSSMSSGRRWVWSVSPVTGSRPLLPPGVSVHRKVAMLTFQAEYPWGSFVTR